MSNAGANIGHGNVYPRADGLLMRCGGPTLCAQCARDAARKAESAVGVPQYVIDKHLKAMG